MSLAEKFNFNHLEDLIDENEFAKFCSKYRCLSGISQVNFLCNMIRYKKLPNDQDIKNVVEIGTDFGITSYFMLKTGVEKYGDNFDLHAFDINSGDFVASAIYENAPDKYTKNFVLHRGMSFSDYCSKENNRYENNKIDMVFIDGQHTHPGPLIDMLYVLPFMKKRGFIALHDINTIFYPDDWGACYVYDAFKGEKFTFKDDIIGYLVVPDDISTIYDTLLEIAKQPFKACIWSENKLEHFLEREMSMLKTFLSKYYPSDFSKELYAILEKNLFEYSENKYYLEKRCEFLKHIFFKNNILETKINNLETKIDNLYKEIEDAHFQIIEDKYKNNKILLYGAGKNAIRLFNKYDFKKLNIVGISDIKFSTETEFNGYKAFGPSNIHNTDYDYILLLVEDKLNIRNYLVNLHEIDSDKIIEI